MKRAAQKIPDGFARAIPRGFRLVKKQGRDFLLVESVFCPRGHNLVVVRSVSGINYFGAGSDDVLGSI